MTSVVLFILGAIIISVLLSKLAKYFLTKMDNKKIAEFLEHEKTKKREKKELEGDECVINKRNMASETTIKKEFKEVLNKQNSSASRKKPNDFHDKQNLDPKFSPNVYRGKNGRFKSKKQWNKEQKIS
jgi:hypothetical protein